MSTETDKEMEKGLSLIFAGKNVVITETPKDGDCQAESRVYGECEVVHVNMPNINIKLVDGRQFAFTLDESTPTSLGGDVDWMLRRKMELA